MLAAFDSPEAKIQKPEARSIWHQANNLRAVVRYLENALKCQLYPRYKKTGASSLIRLGYHPRLIGGVSARPSFPDAAMLMENISNYSSLANQPYPLNVRLEMPLIENLGKLNAHRMLQAATLWSKPKFVPKGQEMHSS